MSSKDEHNNKKVSRFLAGVNTAVNECCEPGFTGRVAATLNVLNGVIHLMEVQVVKEVA